MSLVNNEFCTYSGLRDFVADVPNAHFCVKKLSRTLEDAGFMYVPENDFAFVDEQKIGIYTIRGDAIIAIGFPNNGGESVLNGFDGTITHSDSPCFKIKHNPEIVSDGYVKLNVEPYGSPIYYSWLDRPLSICGSIITRSGEKIDVDFKNRHQVFIPSQAIHINREVNTSNNINPQKDMLPIWGIGGAQEDFMKVVRNEAKISRTDDVVAMDMTVYNPALVEGFGNSILIGPRLDNLASVYAAATSFIQSVIAIKQSGKKDDRAKVLAVFNSEEIGSQTYDGADSNFLTATLKKFCAMNMADELTVFPNSYFLSIDAAHAVHPNAPEKSDPTNRVKLGGGVVVKHNPNYSSNLELEAMLKRNHGFQDFYSRSDMRCGSTLGNISLSHHGIPTLDIGIPMLAMHSSIETISYHDYSSLESIILYFYTESADLF